jgi:rRNA maturation endonuclease Nob1
MAGPIIWVVDSSSLIAIKSRTSHPDRSKVFAAMSRLVRENRLRMPKQVVDEMKKGRDEARAWAEEHADQAEVDSPSLEDVRAVLAEVPDVIDARKDSGVDEADPYVLAMAVHLRSLGHDARIITEELKDFPDKRSLNSAAGMLGVPCVPLASFLAKEKIA